MTKILVAIWALVMIQLSVWTYLAPSPEPQRSAAQTSASAPDNRALANATPDAKADPVDRLKKSESYMLYGREKRRKETIEQLSLPWSSFCGEAGHKNLVGSVGAYYYHRHNEIRVARDVAGADGAKLMQDLYKTPEDSQIDRLTQQTYTNGYFKLTDFKSGSFERIILTDMLKDEKVRGKGCDS
jgi:hypothetical protein